jgi:hypothetical protein
MQVHMGVEALPPNVSHGHTNEENHADGRQYPSALHVALLSWLVRVVKADQADRETAKGVECQTDVLAPVAASGRATKAMIAMKARARPACVVLA